VDNDLRRQDQFAIMTTIFKISVSIVPSRAHEMLTAILGSQGVQFFNRAVAGTELLHNIRHN
jgi:hypothetical protein